MAVQSGRLLFGVARTLAFDEIKRGAPGPSAHRCTDALAAAEAHANAFGRVRIERRRSVTNRLLYALRQQHLPLSAGVDSALAVAQPDE
jgi:hypothetical protein